jgi:aspartyl-tRNA(Asn)/glutamyl-tRNA(Gln) amidotransferase subunit A
MARTVRDCALVLEAIAGYDAGDPSTGSGQAPAADTPIKDWAAELDGGIEGLRVGVGTYGLAQAEPAVVAALSDAVAALERLGARTKEVDTSVFESWWNVASVVLLSEAASPHKEDMERRPEDYGEDVRSRIQWGMDLKAVDYLRALQTMRELRRSCDELLFSEVDLLVMPSTMLAAVPIEAAKAEDPTLGLSRLTLPFNLTGQPAASVPCGFTSEGLPVGLMLAGRRLDERTVLRAARAFEQAGGLSARRPPLEAPDQAGRPSASP